MKIKYLNDNTVELVLEIDSIYKRPLSERKVYKTAFVVSEFKKRHPQREVIKVLQESKIKNFSETGKVKGVWKLELAQIKQDKPSPPAPPQSPPPLAEAPIRVPKRAPKKRKTKTIKEG